MMGRISDHVATMRGCSLAQIVEAIRQMEAETLNVGGDEFQTAWDQWPNKTAKKAAEKAYKAARKRGVPCRVITEGMARYVATKPPDRPWMHLSTFINGERWNDQPAEVLPSRRMSNLDMLEQDLAQRIANGNRSQGSANLEALPLLPYR